MTLAITAACITACAGNNKTESKHQTMDNKTLVAYFSCTGTTEDVAKIIAEEDGATLYRIEPAEPYTSADLDWNDRQSRSTVEMNDPGARPAIKATLNNVAAYDTVYIGYPIWWDQAPRVINSFIDHYKFTGKTVIPFATSGGSSIDNSEKQLRQQYPGINWQPGRLLNHVSAKEIDQWVN